MSDTLYDKLTNTRNANKCKVKHKHGINYNMIESFTYLPKKIILALTSNTL